MSVEQTPVSEIQTEGLIKRFGPRTVVNGVSLNFRAGEVVGLIFDGNIQSLVGDFVFDETQNRAVSVHSSSIMESLKKIYGAEKLAAELGH